MKINKIINNINEYNKNNNIFINKWKTKAFT